MKLPGILLSLIKKTERKTLADYKEEMLARLGRQQFMKLKQLGLTVPVALS